MAANYSAVTLGRIDSVKLNFEITSEMIQDSIKRIFWLLLSLKHVWIKNNNVEQKIGIFSGSIQEGL